MKRAPNKKTLTRRLYCCLVQLRLAAEQEVSPLSMDAAYDPASVMDLAPRPIGGEGPVR
jgi:hypothetical protein